MTRRSRDLLIEAKPDPDKGSMRIAIGQLFDHKRHRTRLGSHVLQNVLRPDRVPAVFTRHKSAACNTSGRCVHTLRLRFIAGRRAGALVQRLKGVVYKLKIRPIAVIP